MRIFVCEVFFLWGRFFFRCAGGGFLPWNYYLRAARLRLSRRRWESGETTAMGGKNAAGARVFGRCLQMERRPKILQISRPFFLGSPRLWWPWPCAPVRHCRGGGVQETARRRAGTRSFGTGGPGNCRGHFGKTQNSAGYECGANAFFFSPRSAPPCPNSHPCLVSGCDARHPRQVRRYQPLPFFQWNTQLSRLPACVQSAAPLAMFARAWCPLLLLVLLF